MPIEYEMMYLKDIVVKAISKFANSDRPEEWLFGAENSVLDMVENNENPNKIFQDYQIIAMRELVSRGYWVKHDTSSNPSVSGTILFRLNRNP